MGFRPRVSETRVYTLHHSPEIWCGRSDLHAHALIGAAVFKTAWSTLPHTAAKLVAAAGFAPARAHGPTGFEAAVFPDFTTPRLDWCGQRESHPHELSLTGSSLRRVYGFATSARMEHPQGRAPCCLSYQDSPSLSTGWMHGRSGRTCTFVAREGVAFTARRNCCSATLRKILGARAGFAPATVSL